MFVRNRFLLDGNWSSDENLCRLESDPFIPTSVIDLKLRFRTDKMRNLTKCSFATFYTFLSTSRNLT